MAALEGELSVRAAAIEGPVETVYLGGGTPSMLSPGQVGAFLDAVRRGMGLMARAELTMEAHPNTLSRDALEGYRRAGINRLSIGAESLDGSILKTVGREYSAARVLEVVRQARAAGFANVSLDLMYGLPGQGVGSWRRTLDTLRAIQPDHVSLYPLSVEPGTVFARREAQLHLPSDDAVVEMYHHACGVLREAGYEHYEVANWARSGHRSRHNLACWKNVPFAAVGVGAHGYLHGQRYVNMRGVKKYIDTVAGGTTTTISSETIDAPTELDDYLMLGLRLLTDGVSLEEVDRNFGTEVESRVLDAASGLGGDLRVERGRVMLREEAVPMANAVWSRFIGLGLRDGAAVQHLVSD